MRDNRFQVLIKAGRVCAMALLSGRLLSPEEALNLAAYLVRAATRTGAVSRADFDKILEEIWSE